MSLPRTSLALAAAAATFAFSLHGTEAFTAGPAVLPGAARSLSSSCIAARTSTLPLASSARTVQKRGALSLRAKEEFAEGAVAGGFSNKGEAPFQIRGFSLASVVLYAGLAITIGSFYSYFTNGNAITSLGFVYGLPITLGGFALKYAEILPVTVVSTPVVDELWEKKSTEILRKIREDVTRHRYGDDAHLDSTLEKLGLVNPGKKFPQMQRIELTRELGGELGFSMVFQSIDTPYKTWADPVRIRKYETFFGPNVNAEVIKVSKEERLVAIKLVTGEPRKGTGAIRDDDVAKTTAGGASKMETATVERKPEEKKESRSMEV